MTTYNTGNPIGSTDARDLYDNSQNLDNFVNGAAASYTDRFGVSRRSLAGIDAAAENVLNSIGYAVPVAYASGISLTLTSQTVEYSGVVYAPKLSALPFTTSSWGVDAAKFRAVQVTDAAYLSYQPAGTGAVATTVEQVLDESVSVFRFMTKAQIADVRAGTATIETSALIQTAINSITKGDIIIPGGTWNVSSTVIVNPDIRLLLQHNTTIVHGADVNLFKMRRRSRFEGGRIDTSSLSIVKFSKTVFDFDGSETANRFAGVAPTVVRTELHGTVGVGSGTAFHLHAKGTGSAYVYGVQIDSAIRGYEYGVLLEQDSLDGSRWINGNWFRLRGHYTTNFIKMVSAVDGIHIDGNIFHIDYQYEAVSSSTIITCCGRNNNFTGMVWDWPYTETRPCLLFTAGTTSNYVQLPGVGQLRITDLGINNTFLLFANESPSLKIGRFASVQAGGGGTLINDDNDFLMSKARKLKWVDASGIPRDILTLQTNDSVVLSSGYAYGKVEMDGKTDIIGKINSNERVRFDNPTTANWTSMKLWDVNNNYMARVQVGPADSGGPGFKVLRVTN